MGGVVLMALLGEAAARHALVFVSCRQMSEPHTGLTLKCAKCGVVSTTALSATTASNAM